MLRGKNNRITCLVIHNQIKTNHKVEPSKMKSIFSVKYGVVIEALIRKGVD